MEFWGESAAGRARSRVEGNAPRSLPPGERAGIEEPTSPPSSSREGLGEMLRMEVQGSAGEKRREK